jgi:hypothetical protein
MARSNAPALAKSQPSAGKRKKDRIDAPLRQKSGAHRGAKRLQVTEGRL